MPTNLKALVHPEGPSHWDEASPIKSSEVNDEDVVEDFVLDWLDVFVDENCSKRNWFDQRYVPLRIYSSALAIS
jgi:hypothetical protein